MTFQISTLFKASFITLTLMILGMVIIGGLTRLTGSGLSIVEWKPVTGFIPPLTLAEWMNEFAKYQQSPEFQKINFTMTLGEFQSIFWLEYIHRLWGRLLGFVLLIPTLLMAFKGQYRPFWPLILFLWILGAGQGFIGWLMVKSGLIHDPYVSPYRLAVHLILGLAIFGVSFWTTLLLYKEPLAILLGLDPRVKKSHNSSSKKFDFSSPRMTHNTNKENIHPWKEILCFSLKKIRISCPRILQKENTLATFSATEFFYQTSSLIILKSLTLLGLCLVILTAFAGALVAGFKAGLVYNTFPLMGNRFVPHEFLTQTPWWKDLLENPVSIQFTHRILATCTALLCMGLWIYQLRFSFPPLLSHAYKGVALCALAQFSLGVLTLIFQVPISLATLHQGFAFILFGCLLFSYFLLYAKR